MVMSWPSASTLAGRLIRLPLRLVPPASPLRILRGPARGLHWLPGSHTHGCWLGTYEKQTQALLQEHLGAGGVLFDIGANVGFFTLLGARLAESTGRVVAFEPLERNLAFLRRHVELNGFTNVQVVAAAVAAAPGEGFIDSARGPAMGGLGIAGVPVRLVSLDDMASRGEIPVPTLLKIDVEGAEEGVLLGARALLQATHPTVLLSGHGWQCTQACTRLLEQLGYRISVLRDGVRDGNYELLATAT